MKSPTNLRIRRWPKASANDINVSRKMTARFAITCFAFPIASLYANAEWRGLKNDAGRVVEIVADFNIEELHIDASGSTSFVAKAVVDGEEVGFSAALSKGQEGTIEVMFRKKDIPVMRTGIDIRSIGPATGLLERRLNQQLGVVAGADGAVRVIGPYSAYCPLTAASIAGIALVQANGVGFIYDDDGRRVSGDCFGLQLIIDGPLSRVTVYFYEEGAPGGTVKANQARSQWFQALETKKANHSPEPTPGAVH